MQILQHALTVFVVLIWKIRTFEPNLVLEELLVVQLQLAGIRAINSTEIKLVMITANYKLKMQTGIISENILVTFHVLGLVNQVECLYYWISISILLLTLLPKIKKKCKSTHIHQDFSLRKGSIVLHTLCNVSTENTDIQLSVVIAKLLLKGRVAAIIQTDKLMIPAFTYCVVLLLLTLFSQNYCKLPFWGINTQQRQYWFLGEKFKPSKKANANPVGKQF